jgi:perosamine synthetase
MARIPIAGPSITDKEVAYVADAARNAWFENAGEYHRRFESAFADHLGVPHATALPSCTAALHLALSALGVGPGDEVIVPEVTWIATAAPISYVGAVPRFCDVDRDTWCISVPALESLCGPRTRAIIAVDLYGGMPDWDALREVAGRRGIPLIEDAAEAIGSRYRDRPAGALGDIGVFSFHGSKTLTTGEGGMLVTADRTLFERVQFLRDHGRANDSRMFWNSEVAFKYKMSALQAALGLAQLERLGELLALKRATSAHYARFFAEQGLASQRLAPGVDAVMWMNSVVLPDWPKERAIAALRERNVDSRPVFYPLSSLPAYAEAGDRERAQRENAVAYAVTPCAINLPSAVALPPGALDATCRAVLELLGRA